MRKTLFGFVVLAICLSFSSVPAHAQTIITLNPGSSCLTCMTFKTTGSGVGSTLTISMTSAGVSGTADFTSSVSGVPSTSSFTLKDSAPIVLTETAVIAGIAVYSYSSGGPLNVTFSNSSPAFSLDGSLSVQGMTGVGNTGTINPTIVTNFTINPSSSYCSLAGVNCSAGGYGEVFLRITGAPVVDGKGGVTGGTFDIPATDTAVTPEPTSLLLFGTGLLALGEALRRRMATI